MTPAGFLDLPEHLRGPESAAVVIPVPYDLTSTYRKGADKGPAAIIAASAAVEWYDIETESEPCQRGIATDDPVLCDDSPERLATLVRTRVATVLARGQLPIVLGGEHSVTIGAVQAAHAHAPDLSVLQLDAHADTRESYEGSTHNHACVMARVHELCESVQVGIRSIDAAERPNLKPGRVFWAHDIADARDDAWMHDAIAPLSQSVYLTVDLDVFDPSIIPSTGTPEPGGLNWRQVNTLVRTLLASGRQLIGFDVVELCPTPHHHASDFTAAKLVYRIFAEHVHAQG